MEYQEKSKIIYDEWKKYVNGDTVNECLISAAILDSWDRCRDNGVNPHLTTVPLVLSGPELGERVERNRELIDISQPFMEKIYGFVVGSGFLVALFDTDGYMLKLVGDIDVQEKVRRGNFVVGSCWSEKIAGTNGAGTVLILRRPFQVYAAEHYCINSHKWTCSGAPINSPAGKLIGAIDMTGPYQKANPHTLGMVAAAAYAIENEMRLLEALKSASIANSFQETVISSIPEIIITVDNKGFVSMMNKNVRNAFGEESDNFSGENICDIWSSRNKNLVNIINNNETLTDAEVRISSKNGQGDFTISCYPILSRDEKLGKVLILNEIKRARSLAAKMLGAKAKFRFENIIGRDEQFLETVRQAKIASSSHSNVLLLGESGTGKDIFAQAIHNSSDRGDGPYVAINCAAIPRDLITSELFGYSEGAFTGSKKGGNQGKFELADGGTIFLDEIGEMPLELQTSLLRVIEDRSIVRIGGSQVTDIDVRILCATNKNLKEEVRKGRFREDLYYRLNVFTISLMPLRERKDDIPFLVESFVKKISGIMNKKVESIDKEVLKIFNNYDWPGNVRELQNVLERMINIAHTKTLTVDLLPAEITDCKPAPAAGPVMKANKESIAKMLKANIPKKEIAKKLGISRSTLYRKLNGLHNTDG